VQVALSEAANGIAVPHLSEDFSVGPLVLRDRSTTETAFKTRE
jgi:hypothetical protein